MELKDAIKNRHSTRKFSNEPISKDEIDKLLWAGKSIPSAGGFYPLKIDVFFNIFVEAIGGNAPLLFIICADFEKNKVKYGTRGKRYCVLETGHSAQNICLMATALGLGSCCVGAFYDLVVQESFKLDYPPIYMVAVGRKK